MSGNRQDPLTRLAALAGLIRDLRQAEQRAQALACTRIRNQLADLDAPVPGDPGLPLQIVQETALRHLKWAEPMRITLNEALARETALLLNTEAVARRATGRAMVLERLAARSRRGQLS